MAIDSIRKLTGWIQAIGSTTTALLLALFLATEIQRTRILRGCGMESHDVRSQYRPVSHKRGRRRTRGDTVGSNPKATKESTAQNL